MILHMAVAEPWPLPSASWSQEEPEANGEREEETRYSLIPQPAASYVHFALDLRLSRWMSQASTPVISLTSTSLGTLHCCTMYLFLSSCSSNFSTNFLVLHTFTCDASVFPPCSFSCVWHVTEVWACSNDNPLSCHILVSISSFTMNPSHVLLQISYIFLLWDSILLFLASCLEHLTHNRGVPCTDDLPRRQMLLLNSRLSVPSPSVLPQLVSALSSCASSGCSASPV